MKKGAKVKEEKDGQAGRLNKRIRRLEKDKKELISKLRTAEAALEKNLKFLKGSTEDVTVEDLIEAAKNGDNLKELKEKKECPNCKKELTVFNTPFGNVETCPCGFRRKNGKEL